MPRQLLPKQYMQYLGLGAEIAVSIAGPIFLGYLADEYFGISPWGIFAGIIAGLGLFIFTAVRIAGSLNENND